MSVAEDRRRQQEGEAAKYVMEFLLLSYLLCQAMVLSTLQINLRLPTLRGSRSYYIHFRVDKIEQLVGVDCSIVGVGWNG